MIGIGAHPSTPCLKNRRRHRMGSPKAFKGNGLGPRSRLSVSSGSYSPPPSFAARGPRWPPWMPGDSPEGRLAAQSQAAHASPSGCRPRPHQTGQPAFSSRPRAL